MTEQANTESKGTGGPFALSAGLCADDFPRNVFEANIKALGELTKYSTHPIRVQTMLTRYNEGTARPLGDYMDAYTQLRWLAFKFGWDSAKAHNVELTGAGTASAGLPG